ncbi:TPA: hypothetical protein ACG05V_005432 [Bacillus pacificus]|uniref:hypothetical protein n=1 Tax=Bacillus cereus group TaxID=86661 RepID=UPI0029C590C6|nr:MULTISPECIES: hypothetical protein [unclassified Bacillus cereus group]MDX5840795.1 hypothetical protein [Bacillus cereus group sp. BfR-BA-01700]MDX5846208.1 hypothetical protein [Bacillus cereus group sp. BfR-BA-01233]MDX5941834.1 hypothetical protein [Bacillus cereus group sp. BfR-BA-00415]
MGWKMKSLGILSVFSLALVGCGEDKNVETTSQNKTGTTEEKSVNKTSSTDSKTIGSKTEGEISEEIEGGGRIVDPKSPFRIGKVEQQLGKESFTNLELDKYDEDSVYFIPEGNNLGVLFISKAKPYISTFENGKWAKDKEIKVESIVPGGEFVAMGYGALEIKSGESQVTHVFVNYKGDVVFKDKTDNLRSVSINESLGSNKLQNSIVGSSKGNLIFHKENENHITVMSQKDGKEVMKLDRTKDSPGLYGYFNVDKKTLLKDDEIYEFDKKKYVYDTQGQRMKPDKNGKVVASDKEKYFFFTEESVEKSNGQNIGHFEIYEQKLGPENQRKYKMEFPGFFKDKESYIVTDTGEKIVFYGYYRYEDKPAVYMTQVTYKNNKNNK